MSDQDQSSSSSGESGAIVPSIKAKEAREQQALEYGLVLSAELCKNDPHSTLYVGGVDRVMIECVRYIVHRQKVAPFLGAEDMKPHEFMEYLLSVGIRGQKFLQAIDRQNLPASVDRLVKEYVENLQQTRQTAAKCPQFSKLSEVHAYCTPRCIVPPDNPDFARIIVEEQLHPESTQAHVKVQIMIDEKPFVMDLVVEQDEDLRPVVPAFTMTEVMSNGHFNFAGAMGNAVMEHLRKGTAMCRDRLRRFSFITASLILARHTGKLQGDSLDLIETEHARYIAYGGYLMHKFCVLCATGRISEWWDFCRKLQGAGREMSTKFPTTLRIRTNIADFETYVEMLEPLGDNEMDRQRSLNVMSQTALIVILMMNGFTLEAMLKHLEPGWYAEVPRVPLDNLDVVSKAMDEATGVNPRATDPYMTLCDEMYAGIEFMKVPKAVDEYKKWRASGSDGSGNTAPMPIAMSPTEITAMRQASAAEFAAARAEKAKKAQTEASSLASETKE